MKNCSLLTWLFAASLGLAQTPPSRETPGVFREAGAPRPAADLNAVRDKLRRELVSVLDFGAKCDGAADDSEAITSALTAVSRFPGSRVRDTHGANGGTVLLPPGACGVTRTVVIPRGVNLVGASVSGSAIMALPGFPANSAVVRIGELAGSTPLSYSSIRDMWIDCVNAVGCTGIYSSKMEENSYIENVLIGGYSVAGIDLESYGVQNAYIRNITAYTPAEATEANCVKLVHATSRMMIENATCNANPAQKHGAGFELIGSEVAVNNVHCEYYDVCVDVGAGSIAEIHNIKGHVSVGVNIKVAPNAAGAVIENSAAGTHAINVCDQLRGGTGACGGAPGGALVVNDPALSFYTTGFNRIGNILTSSGSVQNVINSLRANALIVGPSSSAPPCAGGADEGRIWVNSSVNPARFEVCLSSRGSFGWQYTAMTPGP